MSDAREAAYRAVRTIAEAPEADLVAAAASAYAPEIVVDASAPIGRLNGVDAVLEGLIRPVRRALRHVRRRDDLFIGGSNRRARGGEWAASVTHYVGTFVEPLFGVSPSGRLAYLRSGEFHRVEQGRIVETKIILDLIDLMRQAGRPPLPDMLGAETLWPAPETHDGVLPADRSEGTRSLDVVERMIAGLHAYDPETFGSDGQTGPDGVWSEDMFWYGPGGIGSTYRWDGFVQHHREAFLRAFPDRKGGDHYCRIGDGSYAAISGWPSMTMTHQDAYLGVPATGRALTLRVMDFYRCAGGQIQENWVALDYIDLFAQMGVDLIARSEEMR